MRQRCVLSWVDISKRKGGGKKSACCVLIFNLQYKPAAVLWQCNDHFSQIAGHFVNPVFWLIRSFDWFALICWSGSCLRSRRYVWPAATSATWETSCSWARGFTTGSPATLPHLRSSTSTPPPREDLTNQASQSTSVLSASATRGKWWARENTLFNSWAKEGQTTSNKNVLKRIFNYIMDFLTVFQRDYIFHLIWFFYYFYIKALLILPVVRTNTTIIITIIQTIKNNNTNNIFVQIVWIKNPKYFLQN